MIRTYIVKCNLDKARADALNKMSADVYNWFLKRFWELVGPIEEKRKWPSIFDIDKEFAKADINKFALTILSSNAIDCARDGVKNAIKSTRAAKKSGVATARYNRREKQFRTTSWNGLKHNCKVGGDYLLINGNKIQIAILLPKFLRGLPIEYFQQVQLVYNRDRSLYNWHITCENGNLPEEKPGDNILACDMGEIHPIAATNGKVGVIISARELRSQKQYRNKRLASLTSEQSKYNKGSIRWRKLQRRKAKFLAKQKRIEKDILHKVSRQLITVAKAGKIGKIVLGDIRNIGNGKRLNKTAQQAISGWQHGQLRQFITYKGEEFSIETEIINEAYTSQTCPQCGHRYKPKGRNYNCPDCGFTGHRDIVGATNIYSKSVFGEFGKIKPIKKVKYLRPYRRSSPVVIRQVAQ